MRFVALDTAAALRAAAVCRNAAWDVRRTAARIDPGPLRSIWEGVNARAGERDLRSTHEALHARALALEDTAEAIEQGLLHARRAEERLAAEDADRRAREQAAARASTRAEQRRDAAARGAGGAWAS